MRTIKLDKKQQLKQSKGISTRHNPSVSSKTATAGITLIALVITIIVLLILAGVSIATLTGDNGLLTKSNEAVVENEKGEERDQVALAYQAVKLDELADSDSDDDITADNLKTALENNGIKQATVTAETDGSLTVQMPSGNKYKVTQTGVITDVKTGDETPPALLTTVSDAKTKATVFQDNTKLTDDYGNPVTIPEGFKIASDSATYVGGGIVIEDATYEGTIGSQFVWIPVGEKIYKNEEKTEFETIELGRYKFTKNSDGTVTTSAYTGDFVEENSKDTQNLKNYGNAIAEDIEAFKASTGADKNGGYYIGRYEAGLDINSKLDTSTMTNSYTAPNTNWTGWSKQDGTETQIVCKQGQQVWNYITQNKASELSRNMYASDLTFTSDLINSYAWDTAIVFIQKFGEKDNSSTYSYQVGELTDTTKPSLTGLGILSNRNEVDEQCNIYDMAGNTYEWSTETCSNSDIPCVSRGGVYNGSCYFTSGRGYNNTTNAYSSVSFRPLLYL